MRRIVRQLLELEGWEVVEAASSSEALQLISAHRATIRLVITDVLMPGPLNGLQLGQQIREGVGPDVPVLFLSAFIRPFSIGDDSLVEGENFLPKPFEPARLRALVHELTSGKPECQPRWSVPAQLLGESEFRV